MSIRWPRFLPRLPALLLIPALVPAWASLMWGPESSHHGYGYERGYERGFPLVFEVYSKKPLSHRYTWNQSIAAVEITIDRGELAEFRVPHFLFDLAVALVVAYLFAMAVDRLLFPLVRRLHGKKPEQGEAG